MYDTEIYRPGFERRCWNGENATRERGCGGMDNLGAKGNAFVSLPAGQSEILLDVEGTGCIDHIWLTFKSSRGPLDPRLLRALRLEMYWDGADRPAVSVPLGDFFGVLPGVATEFETELFTFPRHAAFNSYVKMPFYKAARILLTNDSDQDVTHLFYTVEYALDPSLADKTPHMYFHAAWRREVPNKSGEDFDILPQVSGRGRFLGCHIGIHTDPCYAGTWWGEGEVKAWIDGDSKYPSLIGTGAEDYLGTGWGLGEFRHRYQGCLLADAQGGRYAAYRHHLPDPVIFHESCHVAIQTIGGAFKKNLMSVCAAQTPIQIVTIDKGGQLVRNLEKPVPYTVDHPRIAMEDWCNFFRQDDWCVTALFYLEFPENTLPELPGVHLRML